MDINFVFGSSEFLIERRVHELAEKSWGTAPTDTLSGNLGSSAEAYRKFIQLLREAVATPPLFGGRQVLWIRSLAFVEKAPAEENEKYVDEIFQLLARIRTVSVPCIISSQNVDRRLKYFKQLTKECIVHEIPKEDRVTVENFFHGEIRRRHLHMSHQLGELFLRKVGGHLRIMDTELEKLQLYDDGKTPIDADTIAYLTCRGLEENFFEPLEAFYERRAQKFCELVEYYFAIKGDVRTLIAAFQGRNRTLLQLKVMGIGSHTSLKQRLQKNIQLLRISPLDGVENRTNLSLYSQNPWYLLRIVKNTDAFTVDKLLSIQKTTVRIFEKIISQSEEQESIFLDEMLRELATP
ncbi:MAG: hypothetical protein LBI69_02040 [Puniceicoccales bacterium]|jgi:DNA polymerase III delta subunit|nr:hypothetical protein [Puniceicoccales bacterium]